MITGPPRLRDLLSAQVHAMRIERATLARLRASCGVSQPDDEKRPVGMSGFVFCLCAGGAMAALFLGWFLS